MKSKIHYEEDLFFLTLQMKAVREGLQLAVDPEYFQDKALQDLRFAGQTLDKILSTLRDKPNLIRRSEYLYNLVKVETAYLDLLALVLDGQTELAESLAPYRNEWLARRDRHDSDIHEIRGLLKMSGREDEREDVITSDELALLTRADEDPERS